MFRLVGGLVVGSPGSGSAGVQEAPGEHGEGLGDALVGDAQGVVLMVVELRGQGAEGDVGKRVGVLGSAGDEQGAHMEAPETVGAGGVAGGPGFRAQREGQMPPDQVQVGDVERGQSFGGGAPGPSGGGP